MSAGFCLSFWGVGVNNHLVKWRVFVGELAKLSVSWMNENGVCFRILFAGLRDFGLFRYALIIYAFFWNKNCVIILMGLTVVEFLEVHQPLVIFWNIKIRRIILWLLEFHVTYLYFKWNLYFHCHADTFTKNVLQSGSVCKDKLTRDVPHAILSHNCIVVTVFVCAGAWIELCIETNVYISIAICVLYAFPCQKRSNVNICTIICGW